MFVRLVASLGLLCSVGAGVAVAQSTGTTSADTRSSVLGDRGAAPAPRPMRPKLQSTARAKSIARSDKQPPGTENGNQPDRASAGSGGGG